MKAKKILFSICWITVLLTIVFNFSSCFFTGALVVSNALTTYAWYDADGTLLYERSNFETWKSSEYDLPADTDKWDYIEWRTGDKTTDKIAYRVPKESYFVGNVFQIIVKNLGEQPVKTGSAFIFNDDGWFITNAHVMEDAYYAQAIFNIPNHFTGESFTYLDINMGTYYHLDKDIYIGKIENYYSLLHAYYKEIPINLSYEIGERTYSVGYPHSSAELMIEEGEVTESWSDLYEKLYSGNSYICSSSYIAPGSSGGILVNDNLEVIGITTLGWFDGRDEFVNGASISAFNFNKLLQNTNEKDLISLQERFHANEKAYIGFFNNARDDALNGEAEKNILDDEIVTYRYTWKDEGTSSDGVAYTRTETLSVWSDGHIFYHDDIYWENGDRRTQFFNGLYDYKNKFADFTYKFEYVWNDGGYYSIKSTEINYSPTIALTLNKYEIDYPYSYTPSQDDIEYAKERFNYIYEWLSENMAEYE